MATFPSIAPTGREFILGQLPVKRYQSLAGTVWKRVFGNRATAHRLSLEFANIKDPIARTIVQHYYGQNTTVDSFDIPTLITDGMEDATLIALLQNPTNTNWVYAGPPRVRSVFPGISTVSVDLEAELTY